ncbi:MAG: NnrS family protein [bacterium]
MKFAFKNLLLEPYRLFFGFGALYSVSFMAVWFEWLLSLSHHAPFAEWQLESAAVHSHTLIYGVIGFYVFGFSLTAFPRFVGHALPGPRTLLPLWSALLLSQIFLLLGAFKAPFWIIPAAFFEAGSYLVLTALLTRFYLRQPGRGGNRQPVFILIALFSGGMGSLFFHLFSIFRLPIVFYRLSLEIGTYPFLLLLVVSITYRIVPFFTGRIVPGYTPLRGKYTLEIVTGLLLLRLTASFFPLGLKIQNFSMWILNLALLFVLGREWKGWLPSRLRQAPILMVLYLGLGWILIFLGFSGFELVYHLAKPEAAAFSLFSTPSLHALYVGAFGTLLLGISTRVVRGHGGLPMVADPWMLLSLLCIQAAALIRVFFPVLGLYWKAFGAQTHWAGFFWCLAFGLWSYRYLPILGWPKTGEEEPPIKIQDFSSKKASIGSS